MKLKLFKFAFHIFMLSGVLATLFNFQLIAPVLAAGSSPEQVAAQFIKPDGTLDLSAGYNGNLDIKNYKVILDPALGPVLRPLMVFGLWNALGTAVTAEVSAIAISGANVYVGGDFTSIGGDANMNHIAKWNGTAWSALDTGLNGEVLSIAISGTDIYAGGAFTQLDGDKDYIAKWNGTAWSALGATTLNNGVYVIAISGTDVYAGGAFINAGGDANADFIAKWNGTAWSALGAIPLNNAVHSIAVNSLNSDIYAGGTFTDAGGDVNADRIAKWNGAAWSALGTGLSDIVRAIGISGTNVYAGGSFLNAGGDANADRIAKWNGTTWSALGAGLNNLVNSITISGADVYVGGNFDDAGGDLKADKIAKWNGTAWSALGVGLNDTVGTIAVSGTHVYAGGTFSDASGNPDADFIAKFVPDLIAPTVVSSVRVDPNPTNKANVRFTVTFSEAVMGVDATDFSLTTTPTITGAAVLSVAGTGTTRTVTVKTGSGNGTVRLDVLDNNSIVDLAGNPLNGAFSGQLYQVNKVVIVYSYGGYDGWVLESSEASGVGGSLNIPATTFFVGDDAARKQYRGIISFNTGASLPDNAVITAIVLKVKQHAVFGGGNPIATFQGLFVDIKKGFFFSGPALQTTDFHAAANKSYGPFNTPLVNGWYNISLTASKAYINKLAASSGVTQIRLRFKLDDNNNAVANYLSLYSGNAPLPSRPQLVIVYYVP